MPGAVALQQPNAARQCEVLTHTYGLVWLALHGWPCSNKMLRVNAFDTNTQAAGLAWLALHGRPCSNEVLAVDAYDTYTQAAAF